MDPEPCLFPRVPRVSLPGILKASPMDSQIFTPMQPKQSPPRTSSQSAADGSAVVLAPLRHLGVRRDLVAVPLEFPMGCHLEQSAVRRKTKLGFNGAKKAASVNGAKKTTAAKKSTAGKAAGTRARTSQA